MLAARDDLVFRHFEQDAARDAACEVVEARAGMAARVPLNPALVAERA